MKHDVKLLEKMGQTLSINQFKDGKQMFASMGETATAFDQFKNQDLVCLILPDDDDEE